MEDVKAETFQTTAAKLKIDSTDVKTVYTLFSENADKHFTIRR